MGSDPRLEALMAARELELEAVEIASFIALLGREQAALTAQRVEEVEEIAAAKSRRVAMLSRFGDNRSAVLKAGGHSEDAAGMREWVARQAAFPEVASAWAKVSELARQARDQNEVNGWLAALQMQRAQRQLAFLNSAASNEPMYSADGATRATFRQRSLGEA
jgi:flagellar biosynthesis/type III secretory pathway chaperone